MAGVCWYAGSLKRADVAVMDGRTGTGSVFRRRRRKQTRRQLRQSGGAQGARRCTRSGKLATGAAGT